MHILAHFAENCTFWWMFCDLVGVQLRWMVWLIWMKILHDVRIALGEFVRQKIISKFSSVLIRGCEWHHTFHFVDANCELFPLAHTTCLLHKSLRKLSSKFKIFLLQKTPYIPPHCYPSFCYLYVLSCSLISHNAASQPPHYITHLHRFAQNHDEDTLNNTIITRKTFRY